MPKKKKTVKKSKRNYKKKKQESLSWAIAGIVQIILAILAITKVGTLGKQVANLIRV